MVNNHILLYKGRGVLSSAIRRATRGKYSHASICFNLTQIYESWQGSGTRTKVIDDWRNVDIFQVPECTEEQWTSIRDWLDGELDKPYDYRSIVNYILHRKVEQSPDRWFCSELVFQAFLHSGIKLLNVTSDTIVHPSMLSWSPLVKRWSPHPSHDIRNPHRATHLPPEPPRP